MAVWIRKRHSRGLWNTEQEVGVTKAGVCAGEIILTVNTCVDIVSIEPVTHGIEAESHEVPASCPAHVVNPLKGSLRIVLIVVRLRVGIPCGHAVDVEVRPGLYA